MRITDDLGRKVEFTEKPKRLISLVPSITEFLLDIEVKELVGRTNFCIHPKEKVKSLPKVGGTKTLNLDIIRTLGPDLIIAVKEENNRSQVEALAEEFPSLVFDVIDFDSALNMMRVLGDLLDKCRETKMLIEEIQNLKSYLHIKENKSAAYLIWDQPMMSISSETYISEMLKYAGFVNVFENKQEAYPVINEDDIIKAEPHYILLSTEPFSFTEKHRRIYEEKYPESKVIIVDGEMFSWYGSRMIKAFKYFADNF